MYIDIFEIYYTNANPKQAIPMQKYIKDQFPFLGIPKSIRGGLTKPFLKEAKQRGEIDWRFVWKCYDLPEREFQYLALDYVRHLRKFLVPSDIVHIERMIVTKPWWESVDPTFDLIGEICQQDPTCIQTVLAKWSKGDHIWLARVAICFQMRYKENTDTKVLKQFILENSGTKEFFLNKAIGWILREYGKINPLWVEQFVRDYSERLAPLSKREALRIIQKNKEDIQ